MPVFVDTSVALATLLAEDVSPPVSFWRSELYASRLLEYETFVRLHALGAQPPLLASARKLLCAFNFVELSPHATQRALEPFNPPVHTLDALHLAAFHFLRSRRVDVLLATYDQRMRAAAQSMEFPLDVRFITDGGPR